MPDSDDLRTNLLRLMEDHRPRGVNAVTVDIKTVGVFPPPTHRAIRGTLLTLEQGGVLQRHRDGSFFLPAK